MIKNKVNEVLEVKPTSQWDTKNKVDHLLDEVGEMISDGRKYLMGDQFTAADLTFASLSAAVLIPSNYGVQLPPLEELPEGMAEQIKKWRAHPAGQFALKLYAEDRR